jgi:hypothetical protein
MALKYLQIGYIYISCFWWKFAQNLIRKVSAEIEFYKIDYFFELEYIFRYKNIFTLLLSSQFPK